MKFGYQILLSHNSKGVEWKFGEVDDGI